MRLTSLLRERLREIRAAGDAGISLVELVVTMGLMTLLGAVTLTLFLGIDSSAQDVSDRAEAAGQARNVLQTWTSYLRVADGTTAGSTGHRIEWITDTDMLFHADLGNRTTADTVGTPDTIWLRQVGRQLVEERITGGGTTSCQVVADGVTSSKLFTANDASGNAIATSGLGPSLSTSSATCAPFPSSVTQTNSTAVSNLQNVGSVEITFTITDSRDKHAYDFAGIAHLPALGGA